MDTNLSVYKRNKDDKFENRQLNSVETLSPNLGVPIFSEEVMRFCTQHNISNECIRFYELIIETFENFSKISVSLSEDYEIPNYKYISFILTLSDEIEVNEIDNILKLEDELMEKIIDEIDVDNSQYFTFNVN